MRKSSHRSEIQKILKTKFKLKALRPGQLEIIESVLNRNDTIAILPTGAGKSLCYQLPALITKGTAIVVSPLISLMKDQKDKLDSLHIPAVVLNSSVLETEQRESLIKIKRGKTEFIYVTPERLVTEEFVDSISKIKIDLLVVDEAHCITQWGHDFRPAYLSIAGVRTKLGNPPILALTATATPEVVADIKEQLTLDEPTIVTTSVYRDNLIYSAFVTESEEEKYLRLIASLKSASTSTPSIIYSSTVKGVQLISDKLREAGVDSTIYHGRLPRKNRIENQDLFLKSKINVMVATTAFGMGIDKPDIRSVHHFNFPGSLEGYYQESGRAGRDGESSECTLYYLKKDKSLQNFFKAGKYPNRRQIDLTFTYLNSNASGFDPATLAKATGVPKTKASVLIQTLKDFNLIEDSVDPLRPLDLKAAKMLDEYFAELKMADDEKLKQMVVYSQTSLCRWATIMKYFGESPGWTECDRCDNCSSGKTKTFGEATFHQHEGL